ncbi:MAG: hypothetical protein IPK83_16190 [Planctomycetes bacterium]|nr:hypothetical protein [Planctomycetota bacterium]
MREPLQTYTRTLFPMIKQARVVKNLIFRGVYFTTATQRGSVILKHLAERMGNDSAQNIPTLEELYPKPRAHFIKDLFFRKVFKEFGLVFRNEQEAAKHQKLAKLLRTASIVVTVVVLASLAYGFTKFDSLIGKARAMVIASMNDKGEPGPAPVVAASGVETDALKACIDISKYRQDLIDNPWAARLLSLFWDSGKPVRDLQSIRAGLFEEAVLRPALRQVDEALRAAKIGEYGDSKDHAERAERFRKCLVVYLRLASYRDREGEQPSLEQRDYDSLFSIVKTKSSDKGDVIGLVSWDQFMSELGQYIAQCSQDANLNASNLLKRPGFSPDETLLAALEAYRRYLLPLARMDETHPDASVKKLMLVKKSCSDIETAYANILVLSDTEVESRRDLEALREEYAKLHTRLAGAFDNCRWEESKGDLGQRGEPLETLAAALSRVREKHWVSAQRDFHFAFTGRDLSGTRASSDATNASSSAQESATGSAAKDTSERQRILRSIGMIASPPVGAPEEDSCLDRIVKRGLGELGLLNTANIKEGATLAELVLEIPALYPGILDPIRSGDKDPARVFGLKLTPDAETVRAKLDQMNATLAKLATASETEASRAALRACIDKVIDAGNAVIDLQEKPVVVQLQGDHQQFWKPEELAELMTSQASLVARAQMTDALAITSASLGNCTKSEWGLAELVDGYEKPIKSQYVIAKPKLTDRTAVADDSARKTTERKPGKRRFGRDRSNDRREPADIEPVEAPAEDSSDAVPRCATRAFLAGIALEVYDLKGVLQDVRQGDYLPEGDEDLVKRCRSAVSKAEEKYFDTYFAMWKGAYDRAGLRFASRVKGNKDWGSIRNDVRSFRQNIKDELEGLIASLFENVVWPERGLTMSGDDAHLLREARNKSWKETRFVAAIMDAPERGAEKPWSDMARDIGKGWDAFAAAVGSYEDLPSDYSNEMLPPVKPMVWRIVDEVIQRKLDDLKFMRDMLEIVQDCQNAADGEVHRRLIALQDGFSFKMETLPYESPDFTGKVIDAGKFSLFLRNIRTAKTVLEPLDRDLPNYALRNRLYFACAQWEKFIKPNDKPAFSEPLSITIKYDPSYKSNTHLKRRWIDAANASEWKGNKPDTNPPNMFDDAQFLIGLRPDTETGGEMIAVSVEGSQGVRCKWDWPTGSTTYSKAKIQLHASGERSNVNVKDMSSAELGQVDRLLLPAVLEQMGFPEDNERTEWSIALGWDLLRMYEARGDSLSAGEIRSLKPEDRVVGTMFVLKLDRNLPPAIECLKPAPSTSSPQ